MLALHAAWTRDDHLALWAEDPEKPRTTRRRSDGAPHPFAADVARVAAAALDGAEPSVRTIAVRLPSAKAGPVRSPQLWTDAPADTVVGLRRWTVEAAALPAGPALGWLLAVDQPDGVVVGDTVRYLAQIARFALDLTGRGQVVPGMVRGTDGWHARWRPYTADPEDAERRVRLVRGMPAALRAADGDPDARPAAAVFDAALLALVDRCARDAAPSGRRPGPVSASPARGSPEDAWVRALTAADPSIGTAPSFDAFAAKLDAWMSAAGVRAEGFRTCFRIGAPENDGPWRLDFLVQASDDPSLLVDAAEVWRTDGAVLRAAGRELRDPQEWLLTDLGRASRLAPSVHAGLKAARPDGLDLDAEGAWTFLRDSAPLLARSGFGILAPKWWGRAGARLGLRMRTTPAAPTAPAPRGQGSGLSGAAPSAMGLDGLLSVQWEVVLGDDPLPIDELERLAALKAPLVRVRGQWVELRPEDIEAALAFYADPPSTAPIAARDALRVGLGLAAAPSGGALPVTGLAADGWLGELLSDAREAAFAPVPAPAGFGATLRPYQERGLGWLLFHDRLGLGACLADDMGLGKTVQLLALLAHERAGGGGGDGDGRAVAPTLLVCPMSLVGNWQREAARFAPSLRVVVHHGAGRASRLAEAAELVDLVITTYALAARDADALSAVAWGRVVLDEAQNIKNAATRQARAIHALPAPRRIALTGTPVENRLSELWSIFAFLDPGLLGTAHAFRKQFAVPVERHGDEAVAARLRRITAPFLLRRVKTDRTIVADLPSKFEVNEACTLTREQATLYRAVVDELMATLADKEGPGRRGAVLAAMTRLKQVCDHPALLLQDRSALPGRSGKLARLEEILDTVVANGERALVFTQFAELGHPLKVHLQERLGREVAFLHGGTPRAERDAMVERFATPSGPPVFLLSLKAGGTGLNLVAANHVVHYDRWWNPAVEDQATDRAFRLGQTKDVQVRKLVCLGTLEERIDAMIEQKRALAGRVVGAGEGWLADLSAAAIRDLVALADDAVAEE